METLKRCSTDCFLVAGEPGDEGRLWEKRFPVCRPGCWRRENGDYWTGGWVAKLNVSVSVQPKKQSAAFVIIYGRALSRTGSLSSTNTPPHCSFRSLLLCGRAVPSWVHLQAHQTFATVLWPPAGLCGKTPELPGQRLPALAAVRACTPLFCLNISRVGWNTGPTLLLLVLHCNYWFIAPLWEVKSHPVMQYF